MKCLLFVFFLALALALGTARANAAGQETGGGMVVQDAASHTYLYDFYEGGIQDLATAGTSVPDEVGAQHVLQAALLAPPKVLEDLSDELNHLNARSPSAARAILAVIAKLQWQVVPPDLIDTHDLGRSPIQINGDLKVIQIAVRDDKANTVWISQDLWNALPDIHKAGLILHEALYHVAATELGQTDSYQTRLLNAYLFDPRFSLRGDDDVLAHLRTVFPRAMSLGPKDDAFLRSPEFRKGCQALRSGLAQRILAAGAFLASLRGRPERAYQQFQRDYPNNTPFSRGDNQDFLSLASGEAAEATEMLAYEGHRIALPADAEEITLPRSVGFRFEEEGCHGSSCRTRTIEYPLVSQAELQLLTAAEAASASARSADDAKFFSSCLTGQDRRIIARYGKLAKGRVVLR
jgi:hypothetical protein